MTEFWLKTVPKQEKRRTCSWLDLAKDSIVFERVDVFRESEIFLRSHIMEQKINASKRNVRGKNTGGGDSPEPPGEEIPPHWDVHICITKTSHTTGAHLLRVETPLPWDLHISHATGAHSRCGPCYALTSAI